MKPTLALHKLPLYNTGRLDDAEIIAAFSARQSVFDRIIADLAAEKDNSRAQHHLLVGQRGMGKTMLLARVAAEIRTGPLGERFVPLVFAEEQYAVDRLSKFWLNCLDSLADAQDRAGSAADAARIDAEVHQISSRLAASAKDDNPLAHDALEAFLAASASIKRRPILLVDNLQIVFERISSAQQHVLREVLMRPGCPILVSASPSSPPESQDYGAAFYDHFKVHYLRPLEVEEMKALMLHLAEISQRPNVRDRILQHPQRLQVLRQLTGGNPRTTATLFFLYAEDFAPSVFGDLENLLDRVTPLYKARFEELSTQQQVIASAIANHWDPVTSRKLSEITGLPMTGISPQLDRLEKTGFLERVSLFEQSSTGYQIAERFFNVWFLMRSASRRQRREVEFLTRFIENFYEVDDRSRIARQLLSECDFSPDRHIFTKALIASLDNKALAADLERHTTLDALRQKTTEARRRLDEILDLSSLPQETLAFSDLRDKLISLVPQNSTVKPDEFAVAILSDRQIFLDQERERLVARNSQLNEEEISLLLDKTAKQRQLDENIFGEEAVLWFGERLAEGKIRGLFNVEDWNGTLAMSDQKTTTLVVLRTLPDGLGAMLSPKSIRIAREALETSEESSWEDHVDEAVILFGKFRDTKNALRALNMALPKITDDTSGFTNMTLNSLKRELAELVEPETEDQSNVRAVFDELIEHRGRIEAMVHLLIGEILALDKETLNSAEMAYRQATSTAPNNAMAWSRLGALYAEHLNRQQDAKAAYTKALEISQNLEFDVSGMIFFYRDILGENAVARDLLGRLAASTKPPRPELIAVQEAAFAAYESNWGLAATSLSNALDHFPGDFAINPYDEWMRESALFVHLNYGRELLSLLEKRGEHLRLRPWYEAIKALHLGNRDNLLNIAPEIRTTAQLLYDAMEKRINVLPDATRRRSSSSTNTPKRKSTSR